MAGNRYTSLTPVASSTARYSSIDPVEESPKLTALRAKEAESKKAAKYANSPLGLAANTLFGLPKATVDVGRELGQGIARTVGAVGITAGNLPTQAVNLALPKNNQQPLPFDQSIPTTGNPITEALFGGKPIQTLQEQNKNLQPIISPYVGGAGSKFLAPPLIAG